MHTLQHGLIAILTDSCSTVVPQYKKKNKFSHHTQWATCGEAKLQNSLRGQTGAVWCNQCSEVIVRAVQDQQSVNFLSLISVSCTLTHSLDMHICRLCQHFFPLSYLLVSCFFFFHVPLHMIIIHVLQTLQAKPYLWNGKLRKIWTGKCLVDNLMVEWPVELSALAAADNWKTWWIFISSSHDC